MKILLLCDDSEVREKLLFTLDSTYGAEVTDLSNLREGEQFLQMKDHGYELLVVDLRRGSVQDLETFQAKFPTIPTIQVVDKKPDRQPNVKWNLLGVVDRTAIIQNLLKTMDVGIQKGAIPRPLDERDFCRIRTKLLLSVIPLKGDIYIKLSEKKYVKLFNKGSQFEMSDMRKYTYKKGVEYLYLRKEEVSEFIEKYQRELDVYLRDSYVLGLDQMADLNESIYETVQELGSSIGFTRDVQQMAKTHVRMTLKAMGSSPKLSTILKKLDRFKGKYIAAHSSMTGFLACAIASHMQWGSEATFHKLNLAAFLHDIPIENNLLAQASTLAEAKAGKFTDVEKKTYQDHPIKAAEVARQFTEVPPDVDIIILQHHEIPDGTGFPRGLTHSYIAPLTSVFLVAHDLADYVLRDENELDIKAFIAKVSPKYTTSQFRKILTALESVAL